MANELLKLEIQVISIAHIIATIFSILFFIFFSSKVRHDKSFKAFSFMQVSTILWMIFKILKTVSPNIEMRWTFVASYHICIVVFEISFLFFTYISYNHKNLPIWARNILYVVGTMQIAFMITNPYHYKFYKVFTMEKDKFGSLFPLYTVVSYIVILIGIFYGVKHFKRQMNHINRLSKNLFSLGILLPLIIHFLYVTKILIPTLKSWGFKVYFDATPIIFSISSAIFVYSTFKFEFDETSPIIRTDIVEHLDSAVCVTDSSFKVIYINQKATDLLGNRYEREIEKALKSSQIKKKKYCEHEVSVNDKNLFFKINKVTKIIENEYLITIDDVSDYRRLENKLIEENKEEEKINDELTKTISELKKQSKIEARTFIAKELHDVIGHSLVVAIKSLEVAKLYYKIDRVISRNSIRESILSLEDGMQSMERLMSKNHNEKALRLKEYFSHKLGRIESLGIETHFSLSGESMDLNHDIYDAIVKTCQELITNSLKHANTKDIFLDIAIKHENIVVRYIDNGIGCENLHEGNGLTGIRERINLLGGRVDFDSSSGEGFMAKLEIETPRLF